MIRFVDFEENVKKSISRTYNYIEFKKNRALEKRFAITRAHFPRQAEKGHIHSRKKTLGGPRIDKSILLLPWFFEEDARSEAFFEREGVKV